MEQVGGRQRDEVIEGGGSYGNTERQRHRGRGRVEEKWVPCTVC